MDAASGCGQCRQLASAGNGVDAVASTHVYCWPCLIYSHTPLTANPAAEAPNPPAGHLGIVSLRVSLHTLPERHGIVGQDKPCVPAVQVHLANRAVSVISHAFRIVLDGTPEVGDVMVGVIDCFHAWRMWAHQMNRTAAIERLHVILGVTKPFPTSDATLLFPGQSKETVPLRGFFIYHPTCSRYPLATIACTARW